MISLWIEVIFFWCSCGTVMSSNTRTIQKRYSYLQNIVHFKLPENLSKKSRFTPSFISGIDSMPVGFFFSVFIWKPPPRTSLFKYITDCFYTLTQRNFLRLTGLRKEWLNHLKLLISKHFVVHRKKNMDKCLRIISIFYVNTT